MTAERKYAVPLFPPEREALLQCRRLRPGLKKKIEAAVGDSPILAFNRKELFDAELQIEEAAYFVLPEFKQPLLDVLDRIGDVIDEAERSNPRRRLPALPMVPPEKTEPLLQFKITLLGVEPEVWRRIQTPDGSLEQLHYLIQTSFGWENCHLHQFRIAGNIYGPDSDEFDIGLMTEDESQVGLCELLAKRPERARWLYEYDFGDDWHHEIVFEGYPPRAPKTRYPLCLEGARACPPEDCGGPWGYASLLEALEDEEHPDHIEMKEWHRGFKADHFDAKGATKMMRRVF